MTNALIAMSLLGPTLVLAQVATLQPLTIRPQNDDAESFSIGPDKCNTSATYRWVFNQGNPCSPLTLWATEGDCGDTPGTADVRFDDVSQLSLLPPPKQGFFTVRYAALPGFAAADTKTPCGLGGIKKTHRLCGMVETSLGTCGLTTASKLRASPMTIVYDTQAPAAPTIGDVTATNGTAGISFTVDSDTTTVIPEWKPSDATDFISGTEVSSSATAARVTGLVNGVSYDFRLRALDAVRNESEPSAIKTAVVIRTVGFWGAYREAGGTDQGGCAAVDAGVWLIGVWALLKRGRR